MQTALYVLWILIPLVFFLIVLWAKLEEVSGKSKRENVGDLFSQALFVSVCCGVTYLLDTYALQYIYDAIVPHEIPIGIFKILLLPFVLLVAAKFWGGSTDILVTSAPNPSAARQKKRGR